MVLCIKKYLHLPETAANMTNITPCTNLIAFLVLALFFIYSIKYVCINLYSINNTYILIKI